MAASVTKLREDIDITKRELKNIRQELLKQKANMRIEAEKIASLFSEISTEAVVDKKEKCTYPMEPIGYIESVFKFKNGIPRQPSLCPTSKGMLKIEKSVFTNPEHSLLGLQEFSHVWILFIFHQNGQTTVKAKVHPPRLNGASVGVFSTRSPHRPSPLGLSLAKLDKIEGDTLFLSGIDLLDGTPVLDIKPYIPMYDNPIFFKEESVDDEVKSSLPSTHHDKNNLNNGETVMSEDKTDYDSNECRVPTFLREPSQRLDVIFTNRALKDLDSVGTVSNQKAHCSADFSAVYQPSEAKKAITEVLQNDPRSIYRRDKCSDKLYYFCINNLHITCWFDDSTAEVLRVKPSNEVPKGHNVTE